MQRLPVSLALLFLAVGLGACTAQDREPTPDPIARRALDRANDDITSTRQNAITRAVSNVSPAVVGINVTEVRTSYGFGGFGGMMMDENDPMMRDFLQRYGERFQEEVHGLGSGFIVSSDGYIVTNDHVAGNASKIVVTLSGGKQYPARIIGTDPTSDIALLKIDGGSFPYLRLGNSDEVIVGEWAIALGNPFGLFDINSKPTVTVGVVSNTGLNLAPQEGRIYRGMIQTDAAISSGNSGGPLVNASGEVIGVNATIYSTAQSRMGAGSIGIGFAIPVNKVRAVVDELKKNGKIDRAFWTGMSMQGITPRIARYLRLPSTEGVVVVEVADNSPASRAGLKMGDVVTAINGERVSGEESVIALLADARPGQKVTFTVLRNGEQQNYPLTLGRRGE